MATLVCVERPRMCRVGCIVALFGCRMDGASLSLIHRPLTSFLLFLFIFLFDSISSPSKVSILPINSSSIVYFIIMPTDLLHPTAEQDIRTHKLKRLVQSPNSFFMDIKCPGCFQITTVFSHAQTVVLCANCNIILCQPTGGRARLTEGCSYRKKVD